MSIESKILKNISNKQAHVLNLTEGLTKRIIENAKEKIDILQAQKQHLMPAFNEKKEYLEAVQKEFNEIAIQVKNIDEGVEMQIQVIQTMSGFQKKEAIEKRIQVLTPREQINGTQAPKRVKWLDEAYRVLEKEGRFLPVVDLVEKVMSQPHVVEMLKLMKSGKNKAGIRLSTTNSIIQHVTISAKRESLWGAAFKPVLAKYNDLIGLYEWMEKGAPKPQMMKQFVYKQAG